VSRQNLLPIGNHCFSSLLPLLMMMMMMIRFLCWHAGGGGGGEGARKERRENHLQLKPEDTPDQALRVKEGIIDHLCRCSWSDCWIILVESNGISNPFAFTHTTHTPFESVFSFSSSLFVFCPSLSFES